MTEKEKQRNGRNKATLVDHSYINSGNYKKKFDHISSDKKLSRLLYKLAKDMLVHRSGTSLEDMYWVDIDTLEIVAQEINMMVEKKIVYSGTTLKNIRKHEHLLTVHTHPNSFPPSIEDFKESLINWSYSSHQ